MRILLVTHNYAPEVGAPQHRWNALVERFVAAGHRVAVLAPSPHFPSGRADRGDLSLQPGTVSRGIHGERVHRLRFLEHDGTVGSRGLDQLRSALDAVWVGLHRFTGRRRPDIVVATAPALPSLGAGYVLAACLRVPLVLEVRDAWPDLLGARHEWDAAAPRGIQPPRRLTALVSALLRLVITALQRGADGVVTTTDSFAEVLCHRGMSPVRVIRNGCHLRTPSPLPAPDRERRELRVLYLGTIGRAQGLGVAVRAAVLAREAGVPVRLRIVGAGAEGEAVGRLIEELDAPAELLPPVPHPAVLDHYAWADTVLVILRGWAPLRWTVPSKLYEVMGVGRHVSGALAGEAAGIVAGATAGHVVPPGDAGALAALWRRLQEDRALLAIGPAPRAWVAEHADDDTLAARYLQLLGEVLRRTARRA